MTERAFAARASSGGKDARQLAREWLAMSQVEFSTAFRGSAMKRAKRRGLARNAAVALGNVGTAEDIPVLEAALAHDEPLVCEHAAWALIQIGRGGIGAAPQLDPDPCDAEREGASDNVTLIPTPSSER